MGSTYRFARFSAAWAWRRRRCTGRISSGPPWIHAGNLDDKDLVAGTTLFIPVHARGALFEVGDGHAGQGGGEVDLSALETSLIGTFQFIVRKDMHLRWPRAETPTRYLTMGLNADVTEATKMAVREMIDFLVQEKHLSRDDAYMLASVAADLEITEVVDGNNGVHMGYSEGYFCDEAMTKRAQGEANHVSRINTERFFASLRMTICPKGAHSCRAQVLDFLAWQSS